MYEITIGIEGLVLIIVLSILIGIIIGVLIPNNL